MPFLVWGTYMVKQVSIQTFLALDHSILKVHFFLILFSEWFMEGKERKASDWDKSGLKLFKVTIIWSSVPTLQFYSVC